MNLKVPRGTKDILPNEIAYWQFIESTARDMFDLYNFHEIRTPIFEMTELFERGIGENTEIFEKEMYNFQDRKGRHFTLRPEGTASIARSYLTNNMYNDQSQCKFYYIGPFFRYERPQAGRYRQFHQIGVENINVDYAYADAEMISMGYHLFEKMGIKNLNVLINSVGCEISRPVIEEKVKQFLSANLSRFPDYIRDKFNKNPLRILDSKDETVQACIAGMPDFKSALSQKSKDHFHSVLEYLDTMKIPYTVNHTLVRGLEYYTETVFEIVSDKLGAQNTLCGGGRYNNLIKELGGPSTPSVGFAFGIERAILLLKELKKIGHNPLNVFFIPIGANQRSRCFPILDKLRQQGLKCEISYDDNLKSQLKKAAKFGANHVLIYGEEEAEKRVMIVKNMETREQEEIPIKDVVKHLQNELTLQNA